MDYYSCEWVVFPLIHPPEGGWMTIDQIISQFNCQLILRPYTTWKIRSDGCHILLFAWCVPSQAQMQACLDALKRHIQFCDFAPATAEDATGQTHPFAPMTGNMEFLGRVYDMGQHNKRMLGGRFMWG